MSDVKTLQETLLKAARNLGYAIINPLTPDEVGHEATKTFIEAFVALEEADQSRPGMELTKGPGYAVIEINDDGLVYNMEDTATPADAIEKIDPDAIFAGAPIRPKSQTRH